MGARGFALVLALGLVAAACGGEAASTTTASTTSTVVPPTTITTPSTTTMPPVNIFSEVESYLISSLKAEVQEFVDGRLAEAGVSASYSISIALDEDPAVGFNVTTQADADAITEAVGTVTILDNAVLYFLQGGGRFGTALPSISGDETYTALDLPPDFLVERFLDGLAELMTELGLPASTMAKMEQTTALDGTQTVESDRIGASWTNDPDSGLSIILERR